MGQDVAGYSTMPRHRRRGPAFAWPFALGRDLRPECPSPRLQPERPRYLTATVRNPRTATSQDRPHRRWGEIRGIATYSTPASPPLLTPPGVKCYERASQAAIWQRLTENATPSEGGCCAVGRFGWFDPTNPRAQRREGLPVGVLWACAGLREASRGDVISRFTDWRAP